MKTKIGTSAGRVPVSARVAGVQAASDMGVQMQVPGFGKGRGHMAVSWFERGASMSCMCTKMMDSACGCEGRTNGCTLTSPYDKMGKWAGLRLNAPGPEGMRGRMDRACDPLTFEGVVMSWTGLYNPGMLGMAEAGLSMSVAKCNCAVWFRNVLSFVGVLFDFGLSDDVRCVMMFMCVCRLSNGSRQSCFASMNDALDVALGVDDNRGRGKTFGTSGVGRVMGQEAASLDRPEDYGAKLDPSEVVRHGCMPMTLCEMVGWCAAAMPMMSNMCVIAHADGQVVVIAAPFGGEVDTMFPAKFGVWQVSVSYAMVHLSDLKMSEPSVLDCVAEWKNIAKPWGAMGDAHSDVPLKMVCTVDGIAVRDAVGGCVMPAVEREGAVMNVSHMSAVCAGVWMPEGVCSCFDVDGWSVPMVDRVDVLKRDAYMFGNSSIRVSESCDVVGMLSDVVSLPCPGPCDTCVAGCDSCSNGMMTYSCVSHNCNTNGLMVSVVKEMRCVSRCCSKVEGPNHTTVGNHDPVFGMASHTDGSSEVRDEEGTSPLPLSFYTCDPGAQSDRFEAVVCHCVCVWRRTCCVWNYLSAAIHVTNYNVMGHRGDTNLSWTDGCHESKEDVVYRPCNCSQVKTVVVTVWLSDVMCLTHYYELGNSDDPYIANTHSNRLFAQEWSDRSEYRSVQGAKLSPPAERGTLYTLSRLSHCGLSPTRCKVGHQSSRVSEPVVVPWGDVVHEGVMLEVACVSVCEEVSRVQGKLTPRGYSNVLTRGSMNNHYGAQVSHTDDNRCSYCVRGTLVTSLRDQGVPYMCACLVLVWLNLVCREKSKVLGAAFDRPLDGERDAGMGVEVDPVCMKAGDASNCRNCEDRVPTGGVGAPIDKCYYHCLGEESWKMSATSNDWCAEQEAVRMRMSVEMMCVGMVCALVGGCADALSVRMSLQKVGVRESKVAPMPVGGVAQCDVPVSEMHVFVKMVYAENSSSRDFAGSMVKVPDCSGTVHGWMDGWMVSLDVVWSAAGCGVSMWISPNDAAAFVVCCCGCASTPEQDKEMSELTGPCVQNHGSCNVPVCHLEFWSVSMGVKSCDRNGVVMSTFMYSQNSVETEMGHLCECRVGPDNMCARCRGNWGSSVSASFEKLLAGDRCVSADGVPDSQHVLSSDRTAECGCTMPRQSDAMVCMAVDFAVDDSAYVSAVCSVDFAMRLKRLCVSGQCVRSVGSVHQTLTKQDLDDCESGVHSALLGVAKLVDPDVQTVKGGCVSSSGSIVEETVQRSFAKSVVVLMNGRHVLCTEKSLLESNGSLNGDRVRYGVSVPMVPIELAADGNEVSCAAWHGKGASAPRQMLLRMTDVDVKFHSCMMKCCVNVTSVCSTGNSGPALIVSLACHGDAFAVEDDFHCHHCRQVGVREGVDTIWHATPGSAVVVVSPVGVVAELVVFWMMGERSDMGRVPVCPYVMLELKGVEVVDPDVLVRQCACSLYDRGAVPLPLVKTLGASGWSLHPGMGRHKCDPMAMEVQWCGKAHSDPGGVTLSMIAHANGWKAGEWLPGPTLPCADVMDVSALGVWQYSVACSENCQGSGCRHYGGGSHCCAWSMPVLKAYADMRGAIACSVAWGKDVEAMVDAKAVGGVGMAVRIAPDGVCFAVMSVDGCGATCDAYSRDADDLYSHASEACAILADGEADAHCQFPGAWMAVPCLKEGSPSNGCHSKSCGARQYLDIGVSGMVVHVCVPECQSESSKETGVNVACILYNLLSAETSDVRDWSGSSASDEVPDTRMTCKGGFNLHVCHPNDRRKMDSMDPTCCDCNYLLAATRLTGNEAGEQRKLETGSLTVLNSAVMRYVEDLMCLAMTGRDVCVMRMNGHAQAADTPGANHKVDYHGDPHCSPFGKGSAGMEMELSSLMCDVHHPLEDDDRGLSEWFNHWGTHDPQALSHEKHMTCFLNMVLETEPKVQWQPLQRHGRPARMGPDHSGEFLFHECVQLHYWVSLLEKWVETDVPWVQHGMNVRLLCSLHHGTPDSRGPLKDCHRSHCVERWLDALMVYTSLYRMRLGCEGCSMLAYAHVNGDEVMSHANGKLQGWWAKDEVSWPTRNNACHELGEAKAAAKKGGKARVMVA